MPSNVPKTPRPFVNQQVRTIATVALVGMLQLAAPMAQAQQVIDLPIDQARAIATQAALAGELELALQIARRLLEVDPDDRAALIVIAAVAPRLDQAQEGLKAGGRAYRVSETGTQRYEAARLTAAAAAAQKRFTYGTVWLRIALIHAPNEAESTRTKQDAAALSRRNPWSSSFSFSVVPSNNVNGGTSESTFTVDGEDLNLTLSEDALALSGYRANLNVGTQYRLYETPEGRLTFGLQYSGSRVGLDNGDLDPDEFATDLRAATLQYIAAVTKGAASLRLDRGEYDFGGERYYDYTRLSFGRSYRVDDVWNLNGNISREWQSYTSIGIDEIQRDSTSLGVTHLLSNGDVVSGLLTFLDSDSPSSNYTFEQWTLRGTYRWSEQLGPFSFGASAEIVRADYPEYLSIGVSVPRRDDTLSIRLNIGLPDFEFAGFSPSLELRGTTAESNVSRFTRDTFSTGLTWTSSF